MEKVIYYCKKCGSAYGGYPNSGHIKCQECGTKLVNTNYSVDAWRLLSNEDKIFKKNEFAGFSDNSYIGETNYDGESSIGMVIKIVSYILLFFSIAGSIIIMFGNVIIGIVSLLGCVLGCFLCIGIGEICNLLNSINNKLK